VKPGAVEAELFEHISDNRYATAMEKLKDETTFLKADDIASTVLFALQQPAHVNGAGDIRPSDRSSVVKPMTLLITFVAVASLLARPACAGDVQRSAEVYLSRSLQSWVKQTLPRPNVIKARSAKDKPGSAMKTSDDQNKYVGMWVTADGRIRHELLPGGRYDEARGKRKSAYRGRYVLTGDHIDYVDDTRFTADGEFRDGVLYHGGMILFKEAKK
jgi:hypothetical protein